MVGKGSLWLRSQRGARCDGQRPGGPLTLGSRPQQMDRPPPSTQNPGQLISALLTGKGGIYKGRSPTWLPASSHPLQEAGAFSRLPCSVELKKCISDAEKNNTSENTDFNRLAWFKSGDADLILLRLTGTKKCVFFLDTHGPHSADWQTSGAC